METVTEGASDGGEKVQQRVRGRGGSIERDIYEGEKRGSTEKNEERYN